MTLRWPNRIAAVFLVFAALAVWDPQSLRAGGADSGQIVLTRDSVQRFLSVYPKVRSLTAAWAKKEGQDIAKADDPLSTLVRVASDPKLRASLDETVREHGFKGAGDWLKVSQSVALACAALKKPSDARLLKEMEKGIAQIEKNNLLPEDAKKKLIRNIREQAARNGVLNPPKENLEIVRTMQSEIEAVLAQGEK